MKWTIAGVLGASGVMLLLSILPLHHYNQPVSTGVILLVTVAVLKLTRRTIGK